MIQQVSRDDEADGTRKVEISGEDAAVEEARRLIEDLVGLGDNYQDSRQGKLPTEGEPDGVIAGRTSLTRHKKPTNLVKDYNLWGHVPPAKNAPVMFFHSMNFLGLFLKIPLLHNFASFFLFCYQ